MASSLPLCTTYGAATRVGCAAVTDRPKNPESLASLVVLDGVGRRTTAGHCAQCMMGTRIEKTFVLTMRISAQTSLAMSGPPWARPPGVGTSASSATQEPASGGTRCPPGQSGSLVVSKGERFQIKQTVRAELFGPTINRFRFGWFPINGSILGCADIIQPNISGN